MFAQDKHSSLFYLGIIGKRKYFDNMGTNNQLQVNLFIVIIIDKNTK